MATENAANDQGIKTSDLINYARQMLMDEKGRGDDEYIANLPLITLHYRANDDTFAQALLLMKSSSPIDRELGCLIVTEFPSINDAPTAYSQKIIATVTEMINDGEKDLGVLLAGLSAIGWQCHSDAQNLLVLFSFDERKAVKLVVANNILYTVKGKKLLPSNVVEALIRLGKDSDDDIRWSIFYDISENSSLFQENRNDFRELLSLGKKDIDESVRLCAASAFEQLFEKSTE